MSEQLSTNNSNSSNTTPKFNIGDMVYFKTYPPRVFTHSSAVVIKIPDCKPPIMIITEVLINSKVNSDKSIEINVLTSKIKYKCLRFFPQKNTLEESWFFESFLVAAIEDVKLALSSDLIFSDTVTLKLYHIKTIDNQTELHFIAPAMVVLEVLKEKNTLPLFDKKTGKEIRSISKQKVKCMWYNETEDKFSEHVFPIEALVKIKK